MTLRIIMNLWLLACSLVGGIYGLKHFFKPRKALYLKLITGSVCCMMFTAMFFVVYMFINRYKSDIKPKAAINRGLVKNKVDSGGLYWNG